MHMQARAAALFTTNLIAGPGEGTRVEVCVCVCVTPSDSTSIQAHTSFNWNPSIPNISVHHLLPSVVFPLEPTLRLMSHVFMAPRVG